MTLNGVNGLSIDIGYFRLALHKNERLQMARNSIKRRVAFFPPLETSQRRLYFTAGVYFIVKEAVSGRYGYLLRLTLGKYVHVLSNIHLGPSRYDMRVFLSTGTDKSCLSWCCKLTGITCFGFSFR
jgi:hypothetical protein